MSLDEIKELQEELRGLQMDNSRKVEVAKSLLSQQIQELKNKLDNPMPEVRTDFQNVRAEMLEGMKAIQKDNSASLSQLSDMNQLIKKIFGIVAQISYKVSFDINILSQDEIETPLSK